MAASATFALGGVWFWKTLRRWRHKSPDELERLRRLEVNACGRIAMGRVVEVAEPVAGGPTGPVLLYDYEVAGVTYEAAQDLSALPVLAAAAPYLPGQIASVKYDPKQPTNSILACETWCGIPELEPRHRRDEAPGAPPEPTPEQS
jgi:hypothetical protein